MLLSYLQNVAGGHIAEQPLDLHELIQSFFCGSWSFPSLKSKQTNKQKKQISQIFPAKSPKCTCLDTIMNKSLFLLTHLSLCEVTVDIWGITGEERLRQTGSLWSLHMFTQYISAPWRFWFLWPAIHFFALWGEQKAPFVTSKSRQSNPQTSSCAASVLPNWINIITYTKMHQPYIQRSALILQEMLWSAS